MRLLITLLLTTAAVSLVDAHGGAAGSVRGRSSEYGARGITPRVDRDKRTGVSAEFAEDFVEGTSSTTMPARDPETSVFNSTMEPCTMEASVTCTTEDDQNCETLTTIPAEAQSCRVSNVTELGWLYTGKDCSESTTSSQSFTCTDFNGSPRSTERAFLSVTGGTTGQTYFGGAVEVNDTVIMSNVVDETSQPLDISVNVIVRRESEDGEVLQSMTYSTLCTAAQGLTLGAEFGALNFASYRNEEVFFRSYAVVQWAFTVWNRGASEAELIDDVTTINEMELDIVSRRIQLAPGESFNVGIDDIKIGLLEPSTQCANVLFAGRAIGGPGCGAAAILDFPIAGPDGATP